MQFRAFIPETNKSFMIPGTRDEVRIQLELAESEVPRALRMILLRGTIFKMRLQTLNESQDEKGATIYRLSQPVQVLAGISLKDSAIRINGSDGMTIALSIMTVDNDTIMRLLDLRQRSLVITIKEE